MSIKLRRVELSNIRSHKHLIFEPEGEGITAIRGANGAGKSTIVDSIAWALFGTKPAGVSRASAIYRTGAVWGKEKCFARVEIEVDGQLLKVERRMISKAGAVECDVWEVDVDSSGKRTEKHVAGTAVSHVESYLRQRMRMDERGFLAAILVQQKQVDSLISATAKERAQVIEKLTGISSITTALNNARAESNTLKKVASITVTDEKELESWKKQKSVLSKELQKKTASVEKLEKKSVESSELSETLREQVALEQEKSLEVESLRENLVQVEARIDSQEELFESVLEEKKVKKAALSKLAAGTNIDAIQEKLSLLRKGLRSKELELARIKNDISELQENKNNAEAVIGKSKIKEHDAAVDARLKASQKYDSLNSKKSEIKDRIASLRSDCKKIEKAIAVITQGEGTCPTCLQHVSDVSAAVDVLNSQIEKNTQKISQENLAMSETEDLIVKNENVLKSFDLLLESFAIIDESSKSLDEKAKIKIGLESDIKALGVDVDAHEKIYSTARREEENKNEYKRILSRAEKISNEIDSLKGVQASLKEKIQKSGPMSSAALSKLRKKYESENDKSSKASHEFIAARGELRLIEEKFSNIDANISRAEDELKKHKEVLRSVEVASTTSKVIEEFRESRIENSVPVIEAYASDLLSRFTEGKFKGIKIDPKFNTTVTLPDGSSRAVGLLSGGELSAAAMALRIAISMLLNGDSSDNLLILDEVLVSQDISRSEIILSTIREVCKGQVVIIAHSSSVDDIADNIVEL